MDNMTQERTKTGRWQRILLVLSLGVNLAVVGLVVGLAVGDGPRDRIQRFDLTVGPLTRAMEPDRRDAVRDALRESGAFRPSDRDGMRADVNALLGNLRADTFDEDEFRDVLLRQRVRLESGQAAVLDAVAGQISDMDANERAAFADRLEEQLRRSGPSGPPRSDRSGG